MKVLAAVYGIVSLFLPGESEPSPGEKMPALVDKAEVLSARIEDQRGKKRKRDNDQFWSWMAGILELEFVEGCRSLVAQFQEEDLPPSKSKRQVREEMNERSDLLDAQKQDEDAQGPSRGNHIPVNELIGQVASTSLQKLEVLALDPNIGRIAIQGMKGIGKTALMKHLHNFALESVDMFDYAFWVTCPGRFSIKNVQDAVAAALKCDLSKIADVTARAAKLYHKFAGFGRFVLFLDGLPEATFFPEQIGIPQTSEHSFCKLVLTTTGSALVSGTLNCFATVQLSPLPQEEALQLFMHKAGIDSGHVSLLDDIPRLIVNNCRGSPGMIVGIATRMRGIGDIHEWRHMLSVTNGDTT